MVKSKIENKKDDALKTQIKEFEDNWKRAVADYQNLKKRCEREKEDFAKYANQRLLEALLPIADTLEQAEKQFENIEEIKLIARQVDNLLKKEGVLKIETKEGDEFNPSIMETIETLETKEENNKNKIAKILRPGFLYKERVLRPTEVKVYI